MSRSLIRIFRFQFTLPRGERPLKMITKHDKSEVQFTLPRGERRATYAVEQHCEAFQFTLPRGERPILRRIVWIVFFVSIHAPARGATGCVLSGVTSIISFNSRSREGSDSVGKNITN